jgi:Flp pilus assembly protein TadG
MTARTRQAWRDDGVAGIEFTLIASVLVLLLLGIVDVGTLIAQRRDMDSSLRAGTEYFMVGGEDAAAAARIVDGAWSSRPEAATVTIAQTCLCVGAVHACNANCPDGSLPTAFHVLSATARFDGLIFKLDHDVEKTIRSR